MRRKARWRRDASRPSHENKQATQTCHCPTQMQRQPCDLPQFVSKRSGGSRVVAPLFCFLWCWFRVCAFEEVES